MATNPGENAQRGQAPDQAADIWPLWIVIPNWNQAAMTEECVTSVLAAARGLPVTVTVVDNGSTDGSPARLKAALGDQILQVPLPTNLGFAVAVNAGIRTALAGGAAAVLLLNNDTVVAEDMLSVLGQAASQHPAAGVLGPAIFYFGEPQRVWRLGDRQPRRWPIPARVPDREVGQDIVPCDYLTGCGMLIRRPVFERVGLFDERYYMYYEDADFCRRAGQAGYQLICVPGARMWHKVSVSARTAHTTTSYWRARGQVMFYRSRAYGTRAPLVHLYVLLKTLLSAGRWALLRREPGQARAILKGTRDGYRAQAGDRLTRPGQGDGSPLRQRPG